MRASGSPARIFLLLLSCFWTSTARATDPGVQFFEQKIRPALVQHCYECHSAQAKKVRGGLLLDTKAGLLNGGDSGPALVPGKVEESLLIKALRQDELAMPPKGKLPAAVVADFERWVALGAPDPRTGAEGLNPSVRQAGGMSLSEGRKFWAYRPPQRLAVPSVCDASWPAGAIDGFVLARLEKEGLRPAPDADRATLV